MQLNLGLGDKKKLGESSKAVLAGKSVFKDAGKSKKEYHKDSGEKRKKSALEEIMQEEALKKKKQRQEEKERSEVKDYWLRPDIVVKIVTKSLGDKFYKQKARVESVEDKYGATVRLLADDAKKVKLDQDHLETVVPQPGRAVLVVNGRYRRETGVLKAIDVDKFCGRVELDQGRLPAGLGVAK